MAKKAATSSFTLNTHTKTEAIADWLSSQTGIVTWKDNQKDVEKALMARGHKPNPNSDKQTFGRLAKAAGKLPVRGNRTTSTAKPKTGRKTSFSQFCSSAINAELDTENLTTAIDLVASCESLDVAREYNTRWAQIVELMGGDTAKAQQAVELLG